jgi:hypothetical protein
MRWSPHWKTEKDIRRGFGKNNKKLKPVETKL